jgi:hypothetical protein
LDSSHAVLDGAEVALGLDAEELARGRQRHLPRRACEQRDAELLLQLANGLAESTLRDVQALRRVPEVAGLSHGGEVAEVAQFHGRSSGRWA